MEAWPSSSSNLAEPGGTGFPNIEDVEAELTIVQNGCDWEWRAGLDATPPPTSVIAPQEDFCTGFTLSFENNSVGGSGYIWEFGEPGNLDVSYDAFPTWTYDGPGTYVVQLVTLADFQCPDTTTEVFEVAWLLEPFFETPDPECFQEHSFSFEAIGVTDPNATFQWNYAPGSADIDSGRCCRG